MLNPIRHAVALLEAAIQRRGRLQVPPILPDALSGGRLASLWRHDVAILVAPDVLLLMLN